MPNTKLVGKGADGSGALEGELAVAPTPTEAFDACRSRLLQLAQHTERVAHQFHDQLTLVLGHATLARSALEEGIEPAAHLEEIQRCAGQATALSQQLLSFARTNALPIEPAREARTPLPGTVLVAEDEPMVAELTRRILAHAGYRVSVAHNGQVALDAIRQDGSDVVLLVSDIVMPEMSGIELASVLSTERPDLPILLVSGYPEDDLRLDGEILVRTPFLPKPFKAADLLAAVEALRLRPGVRIR